MAEFVIDDENNIVEIININIFLMIFILLKYKIKKNSYSDKITRKL